MDQLGGLPGEAHRDRVWPSVVAYSVVMGVISGGLIAAAGAYRVLLCEGGATLIFAVLFLAAWVLAGFRVGRRTASAAAAALTGLLAAAIGSWAGLAVNLWLVNQHAGKLAACLTRSGQPMAVDQVLASEPLGMLLMAIVLPIVGAALSFIAGVIGGGGSARQAVGEMSVDDARAQASGHIADAANAGFRYGGPRDRPTGRRVEGIPSGTEPRDPAP